MPTSTANESRTSWITWFPPLSRPGPGNTPILLPSGQALVLGRLDLFPPARSFPLTQSPRIVRTPAVTI